MSEMTYAQAARLGLQEEMRRDPTVWALGEAGVDVPLNLIRDEDQLEISIHSVSRADLLKSPQMH